MSLLIKICGLRSSQDVDAAVDAGANAVGFVFAESPRRVTPLEAQHAADAAPDGVIRVAVMRHPDRDDWLRVLDEFRPDVLQTDIADLDDLDVPDSVATWPVVREGLAVGDYGGPDTFLYEGADSGRGEVVDWQRAATVARRGNMILAGGLSADNVAEAIRVVRPYGVDVSSAVETQPGKKDPGLIRQFIRAARSAESSL